MRLVFASLLVLAQAAPAHEPTPAKLPKTIAARQLSVTTSQSSAVVAPGGRLSLYVDVSPKPTMHVYAPEQKGGYIRIELVLDEAPAFTAAAPIFPKASDYHFAPLNETFKVYDKPFRIRQDIALTRRATAAKSIAITGTLRYQACDDQVCYRPGDVKVTWTVSLQPLVSR